MPAAHSQSRKRRRSLWAPKSGPQATHRSGSSSCSWRTRASCTRTSTCRCAASQCRAQRTPQHMRSGPGLGVLPTVTAPAGGHQGGVPGLPRPADALLWQQVSTHAAAPDLQRPACGPVPVPAGRLPRSARAQAPGPGGPRPAPAHGAGAVPMQRGGAGEARCCGWCCSSSQAVPAIQPVACADDAAGAVRGALPAGAHGAAGLHRAGAGAEPVPQPAPVRGQVLHPPGGARPPGRLLLPLARHRRQASCHATPSAALPVLSCAGQGRPIPLPELATWPCARHGPA